MLIGSVAGQAQETDVRFARLDPTAEVQQGMVAVPRLLGAADAAQYRMIFALQDKGRFDQADRLIARLGDRLLVGHLLAQRYLHPTAYRSGYEELRRWLLSYADLPEATQIYGLARKRRPDGAPAPVPPSDGSGLRPADRAAWSDQSYTSTRKRSPAQETQVKIWREQIVDMVANDRPTAALKRLADPAVAPLVDDVELAWARWQVARSYFINLKDQDAYVNAAAAASVAGQVHPGMHWTAGLAAWRMGQYALAAQHFTSLTNNASDPEDKAAGAFWAARAYLAAQRPQLVQRFLKIAAGASDRFYGLLARAMAGQDFGFDWQQSAWAQAMDPGLLYLPAARRAIALTEIGQMQLAQEEIQKLGQTAPPAIAVSLAALAETLGLPAAQIDVAEHLHDTDGRQHASARYPVPDWRPDGGFTVDRALVFALVRAESGFDAEAVSPSGAVGLMQIMPGTGRAMAKRTGVDYAGDHALKHPATNLGLGQAYIQKLRRSKLVGDSLIHLCLAYNAGVARLEHWMKDLQRYGDDPLLFLESIPVAESRSYTKKVLANLWAYRERLGQDMPSLAELAANEWPRFEQIDQASRTVARKN
jgi:soluble lytic murein transglycosylase-like protein